MEISTTKVEDDSTELVGYIKQFESEYENLDRSIKKLSETWEGPEANSFFAAMQQTFLPKYKETITELYKHYNFLRNVPEVYSTLDESYSKKKIDV